MGSFTGIGKLPSELTEKTSLSETDIVITGSAAQRTTWKNVLEKISFSGLATTAKNIIGAINELNTKISKKVVNGSYGTNTLGFKWLNGRLVGTVDATDMNIVTDDTLNKTFKISSVVKNFSNGAVSIPFSEFGITARPLAMLLTPQSQAGIMKYDYDNSGDYIYITFHLKQSDGTCAAYTGSLRFCYFIEV